MPLQVLLILPPRRGAEGCFLGSEVLSSSPSLPPLPPPLPAAPSPRHLGCAAAALCSDISSSHHVGKATGAQGSGERGRAAGIRHCPRHGPAARPDPPGTLPRPSGAALDTGLGGAAPKDHREHPRGTVRSSLWTVHRSYRQGLATIQKIPTPALWLMNLPSLPVCRQCAGNSNVYKAKVTPDIGEPHSACHLRENPSKSVKIHK